MSARFLSIMSVCLVITLGGCGSGGNLKADNTYHGSPPELVKRPKYDPYVGQGDVPVIWAAPTFDRQGMLLAPRDPNQQTDWDYYRNSPWFNSGSGPQHPAGTF